MENFNVQEGAKVVDNLILAIQENKQHLSDIDGLIGDGDHGVNMNKGFTMCREELDKNPGDMVHGLNTLSKILMMKIGGSMGPLYGKFFKAIAKTLEGSETVDKELFGKAISEILVSISAISPAKVGDKTLIDCLTPAVEKFNAAIADGKSFEEALEAMKTGAREGRDSTVDLVAKLGRASRLGERSKGVMDAGSASCCLILETMADTILEIGK